MLSAELFDCIFSFLQNDRAALNSCSAAHPFLFSLTERHLFVHIVIFLGHPDVCPPTIPDGFLVPYLFKCLSERPYLANYGRSITIDGRNYSRDPESFEKLSTILLLIRHAERVSLHNMQSFTIPEIFHSALLNCLRTPHMKELSLRKTNGFPMALLDGSRNLKSLKLDTSHCSFKNCAKTIPASLESLSLADVYNINEVTLWAGPRVNSLIALHVKAQFYRFPNLSPIFSACLESLRSLSLEFDHMFSTKYHSDGINSIVTHPSEDFPFILSLLPCLEVVTIRAAINTYRSAAEAISWSYSSLPAITQLVTTAGPSLKRVILNFECDLGRPSDLRDAIEWKPLITLCDTSAHLKVDLCIVPWAPNQFRGINKLVDSLSRIENLSRLVEQGSLAIKPGPLSDWREFTNVV